MEDSTDSQSGSPEKSRNLRLASIRGSLKKHSSLNENTARIEKIVERRERRKSSAGININLLPCEEQPEEDV